MNKIYLVFSHFPFISRWGHIDPEDQKYKIFSYIPSEQPNQAQFCVCVCVCVCVYR